mgnify:CR=1 FL=1
MQLLRFFLFRKRLTKIVKSVIIYKIKRESVENLNMPSETKAGKAIGYLALIPASYLAGHLLVKGFTTTSYQMQRDFSLIILAAALIYAAVMLAINLWRQKREKV